ncbi:MAG: hypothetical protein ABSE84_14850 [Isosphaeraceae bacterium]|jgi:hypothetical protein
MTRISNLMHERTRSHLASRAIQADLNAEKLLVPARSRANLLASTLFVASLVYYLWAATIGWRNAITDAHAFRQTQTALTVSSLLRGGPWLIYETPVLGPPWSIPYEFPLYQWIVASLVQTTGMALDPAGRAVSVVFFLLTLWPAGKILANLHFSVPSRLVILSLLLCSPFYIFWSRTFMIESLSLFLATSSLACVLGMLRRPSAGRMAATSIVMSLAAVVKVTTFLPFLCAAVLVLGVDALRRDGIFRTMGWGRRGLMVLACIIVPCLALAAWTRVAEHARCENPFGHYMQPALNRWLLGTLDQRLSMETWRVIASRLDQPLGRTTYFAIAAMGLIMARRRYVEVLACLAMYLVGLLTFTNLFYVHDYYFFANNIFLIAAVGISITAMVEYGRPLRAGAIAALLLLFCTSILDHCLTFRPLQKHNQLAIKKLSKAIRERTSPDDVVVALGFEWSSEIPYYSERRALCIPSWSQPDQIRESLKALAPYSISAVVTLPPADRPITVDALLAMLRAQGFQSEPSPVDPPYKLLLRAGRSEARAKR